MNTEILLLLLRLLMSTGFVYSAYILLLKKRVGGNASRIFLLGGTLVFSLLPFWPSAGTDTAAVYLIQLPEISVTDASKGITDTPSVSWVWLFYFAGMAVAAPLFLLKLLHVLRLKHRGHTHTENGIRITETGAIRFPFSFGNHVFLPLGMEPETRRLVLAHETVHIHHHHTWDVLAFEVLKIVAWFNPFYFLLEKEVRQAHEFTADETMLQNGVSTSHYCEALLSCALAGMRVPVNYFHGSQIKTRIYMMNKPKNRRQATVLLGTALLLMGTVAVTTPRLLGQTATPSQVFTTVEQMPEFPGGTEAMMAYIIKTVHYPAVAREAKTEGKVYVGFVVTDKGKVTDVKAERSLSTETDAEAVRAVKGMPDWKPGQQNGKPVSVKMVLPVAFKLQ